MLRASFTRNVPVGRVLLAQPIRKQQFHSHLENTWIGRWLNANAPKGFGKFYRKPGEKPNTSTGSGTKDSKGTSSNTSTNEKVNMKDAGSKKKGGATGGPGGNRKTPDAQTASQLTIALTSGIILLYLLSSDELSNQK